MVSERIARSLAKRGSSPVLIRQEVLGEGRMAEFTEGLRTRQFLLRSHNCEA